MVCGKKKFNNGFNFEKMNVLKNIDEDYLEIEKLRKLLDTKESEIVKYQRIMTHYRYWLNALQTKVAQQNPIALKNATKLYVAGFPIETPDVCNFILTTLFSYLSFF